LVNSRQKMFLEARCCRCKPWSAEQAWMLHSRSLDNSPQNVARSLAILTEIPRQWLLPWSATRLGGPWPGEWNVGEKVRSDLKKKQLKPNLMNSRVINAGDCRRSFSCVHTCAFELSIHCTSNAAYMHIRAVYHERNSDYLATPSIWPSPLGRQLIHKRL